MGGLFSSKVKTTSTSKEDTGPSAFQKPYLDQTFNAAQSNYNASKDTPYYQGDTYAGMSPDQIRTLESIRSYAGGAGMGAATQISGVGSQLINGSAGKSLSNLDRFTAMAGEDAGAANRASAAQYANNPEIQGMIDASSRDIQRNLYENQLPGIDRQASGTGNINSSRAGVASGIAQRGAADGIRDISANIRGAAYDRGLSLASSDRQAQMNAYKDAAWQFANLTSQGIDATTAGADQAYKSLAASKGAGDAAQADQQGELDALFAKWRGGDERAGELLQRYQSIIGSNAWGQSGTSSGTGTQKTSGNIFGQIAGAASSVGSIMAASDRRLKTDIQRIATRLDGLGVYLWTYIWGGPQHIGVMADEVARIRPDALGPKIAGTFATVNYAKL